MYSESLNQSKSFLLKQVSQRFLSQQQSLTNTVVYHEELWAWYVLLTFVCLSVHVYVFTQVSKWTLEVNVFLNNSSPYFLRQALLLKLKLTDSTIIAGQLAPGIHLTLLSSPKCRDYRLHTVEWSRTHC